MPITILTDSIEFPDPNNATFDGLVAIDGDLSPERLLEAYKCGIFPWYAAGEPLMWWSPDPRMIVFPDEFKLSKSLRQIIRKADYELKIDTAFRDVITNCSTVNRINQSGTWITPEMIEAYTQLHKMGYAHSFEIFKNNKLVGGLYGISIGKAFFGESMFHYQRDASKIAFYHLVQFCIEHNFMFIDAQQDTSHLRRLGGMLISRKDFLYLLAEAIKKDTIKGFWSKI